MEGNRSPRPAPVLNLGNNAGGGGIAQRRVPIPMAPKSVRSAPSAFLGLSSNLHPSTTDKPLDKPYCYELPGSQE